MSLDFGDCDEYIYYPEVGQEDKKTCTCISCEAKGDMPFEWDVSFRITKAEVTVEYELPVHNNANANECAVSRRELIVL